VCKPEVQAAANAGTLFPEGAVMVINAEQAGRDPEHSIVARIPSGCNPVRLAISPAGDRIYVTARGSNSVLCFDAEKLDNDPKHALIATVPAGTSPVPVAVVDEGKKLVVGSSNRFGNSEEGQSLVVLDAGGLSKGTAAVLGTIPAGTFPREMAVSADGRSLFLTNFGSNSLQVIDVDHLPVAPAHMPQSTP
jgi:DNA-binding beta-propeller fold protein YncE